MYFKYVASISWLNFKEHFSQAFFYENDDTTVLLYDEIIDDAKFDVHCDAICSKNLDTKIDLEFKKIETKHIPIKDLSNSFNKFSKELFGQLNSSIKKTIDVLRWRWDIQGPHNYTRFKGFFWSRNGIDWNHMPGPMSAHLIATLKPLKIDEEEYKEVTNLLKDIDKEPIERELFREAWWSKTQNPRSALIMGISSAEVGFKRLTIDLQPQTEWLLSNIQSPPLTKMLKRYLSQLPAKCKIKGAVKPPPKELMRILDKAIEKRNEIVHSGSTDINSDELIDVLLAINDLLWLFEFYRGFKWAFDYIRPETIKKLML